MKNQQIFKKILMFIMIILCLQFVTADCPTQIWMDENEQIIYNEDYEISIIQSENDNEELCGVEIDSTEYELEIDEKIIHDQISVKVLDVIEVNIKPAVADIFNECKLNFYKFENYVDFDFTNTINNYTYNDEIIILVEANSQSCKFIIDQDAIEIPENEFYVYNDILMKVDPDYNNECEVEFYTILDSEDLHLTTDNPYAEFDNKDIEFLSIDTEFKMCFFKFDSISEAIDLGDEEIYDDVLAIPYYAFGTIDIIEEGETKKTCKLEFKDCECEDEIECDLSCVDYEEENDILTKGTLEFSNEVYEDTCFEKDDSLFYSKNDCEGEDCYVKQFSCEDDSVSSSYTKCKDGCEDGICGNEESIDDPDLSTYPDFITVNGVFNGIMVVGKNAPGYDTVSLTNIAIGLQRNAITEIINCGSISNSGCTTQTLLNPIPASVNEFDNEASLNNNIISIGNPCDNSITKDIVGSSDCDYKLDGDKEGIVYIKRYNGFAHMAVYGLTIDETYDISRILQNIDDYSLNGKINYLVDGELVEIDDGDEEPEVEPEEEDECTESDDGKDFDEKGITKGTKYGSTQTKWTDNCATSNLLVEYYCNNNQVESINYECPDDMICDEGICVEEETDNEEEQDEEDDKNEDDKDDNDKDKDVPKIDLDECKTNVDCKDNNETTTDICIGSPKKCLHEIIDECKTKRECDDKNPCTADTCVGSPKKCSNQQNSGCNLDNVCVPIGTRDESLYCSAGNKLVTQKSNSGTCNNNYECVSNVCVNSNCIEPGLIQKILDWFTNFFG